MKDVNELRKGVIFELDNSLYKVLDYSHHKPGRGNATIKVKTSNLRTGTTLDMTFQSGDRVQDVSLDYHNAEFLYRDEHFYHFMDLKTYEQPAINAAMVDSMEGYLKSNMEVKLTFFDGEPLDIELPLTVDLEVIQADASVRGDTATGVTKKVTTETGLQVSVPNFVEVGDVIRVNTGTGAYVTRV
jgi:elongation factor P